MSGNPWLERAYRFITLEEEHRACEAIPEDACTNVPRNFFLNAFNGACTKLAEQLASPGLVLPWFLSALGAPTMIAGWLAPVKQAGSLIPQLVVAGTIRGYPRRKWFWTGAGATQAVMLAGMIFAALSLPGHLAGWAVLGLLAVFSIASGTGSVAFSDVVGKTIPKRRRGRLLGVRATIGGLLTLGAGLWLKLRLQGAQELDTYLWLIGIAAVLWAVAAVLFGMISELPGAKSGGRNALKEAGRGFQLVRETPGFAKFLAARGFALLAVELALPFYALHARNLFGGDLGNLGLFVLVTGFSATVSSSIWGKYADASSRRVLMAGCGVAVLTVLAALGLGLLLGDDATPWMYTPVFFLSGLATAGVRLGRKTYVVDAAPDDDRPTYVAFSNTFSGLLTLVGGGLGVIAQFAGIRALLIVLGGLALLGILTSWWMPEAETLLQSQTDQNDKNGRRQQL